MSRGVSAYLDDLIGNKIGDFFRSAMPIDVDFLAEYPDFFAFAIIMIVTVLLASGVKASTTFNNIFTFVNLMTIAIVLVSLGIHSDPQNWAIDKEEIPEDKNGGEGGFAPFGFAGIVAGAGKYLQFLAIICMGGILPKNT